MKTKLQIFISLTVLLIPACKQNVDIETDRIASALDIMLEGPLGGAAFNNEFGRPALAGYFRSYEQEVPGAEGREVRGYHKPIMIAGGLGNIRAEHVDKQPIPVGAAIVVLGGPAMLIGLGGGAASSMASGASHEDLDFASVQRDNPEMQRRCQEVIDRCWALGEENPVVSIHDVGAGGLSNALPELVHGGGRGARFELRRVPNDEPGMSPLEIWCNEAQERYVLAIGAAGLGRFEAICARERCPYAVVGHATADDQLVVDDEHFGNRPIEMPLGVLLGKPPRMRREGRHVSPEQERFEVAALDLAEATRRVLSLPTVADKTFLVTIGDRSVTGLVARDQMVGRFQVPVADAALTLASYDVVSGEAMAMGERSPVAVLDAAASARLAVAEAITNIASAPIAELSKVKLSANWMAAAGHPGEDARLYDAVRAVGAELCPALGIAIPVGKDSMSMRTVWDEAGQARSVTAPLSLIVSAFAPVEDVRRALTPGLSLEDGDTELLLVDLGRGQHRLGASCLSQVYGKLGDAPPDLDDPALLRGFFTAVQLLGRERRLVAYHDRSDGGLLVTLLEMAFAGGAGLEIDLGALAGEDAALLFSEELGAVLQVRAADVTRAREVFAACGLGDAVHGIGRPAAENRVVVSRGERVLLDEDRFELRGVWSATSHRMQALRDDPACADEEQESRTARDKPGLVCRTTFDVDERVARPFIGKGARPRVAILREQGVNGQVEMAAAFDRAGIRRGRRAHERSARRRGDARWLPGAGGLWRLQLRRRAGRRRRLGEVDPVQPAGARDVPSLLRAGGQLHPRRLQRLPDAVGAARADSRRWRLAPLRAEPFGAVRSASVAGARRTEPVDPALWNGGLGAADRGRARRRACRSRLGPRQRARAPEPRRRTLRHRPRVAHRALSRKPQRLAPRHHRAHHARRPRDDHDAAPRARVPRRAVLLAAGRVARGRALDAPVRQRARLGRVERSTRPGYCPGARWKLTLLTWSN